VNYIIFSELKYLKSVKMPVDFVNAIPGVLFMGMMVGVAAFLAMLELDEEDDGRPPRARPRQYGIHPLNRRRSTQGKYPMSV
jgi:hypothetical protein